MIRRTFFFLVTVAVASTAGYQLAWNRDILENVGGIGFFGVVIAFLAVAAIALWRPNRFTVALAFVLGMVTSGYGGQVIDQITWSGVGWAVLALALLVTFWVLTIFDGVPGWIRRAARWVDHWAQRPSNAESSSGDEAEDGPRAVAAS